MVAIATEGLTKVFPGGQVAVDGVDLAAGEGEFLVLLGPTGCGKSTILRLVAGLEQPTRGHVRLDGRVADGVSPADRGLAMVFQDYALYPHLTVAQNIAFPLRAHPPVGVDPVRRVTEVAAHLGIADLLDRLPGHLSGGQRQRVAMARAVVGRPRGFLLDEPMSNVDAALRAELRTEVALLARRLGVTTLYVTHDQTEAMTMADRVAVLRRGVLQQVGPPAQVYGDPATVFVAAFLGTPRTNLMQGAVYADPDRVVVDLGSQVLELPPGQARTRALAAHHTERVTVALRADALQPVPAAADRPVLRGSVRLVEHLGHEALIHVDTDTVPTTPAQARLELPEGPHLAEVAGREAPGGAASLRGALARMIPHQRGAGPGPDAAAGYGLRPAYDLELPGDPQPAGEVVVRVPAALVPRRGERLTLAVDLDRLFLFDGAGARIRLD
ncbi:MAG TPA: ABC transporter ATP-binding protein [Pilimelia sp.]|nr:ABC transporter ATP-binding protein [Pilimelia sp.]